MAWKAALLRRLGIPTQLSELAEQARRLEGARPLFVLGTPRSGTTLLARLLDAHPAAFVTNENGALVQMHYAIHAMRARRPAGLPYEIESKEFHDEWAEWLDVLVPILVRGFYARLAGPARTATLRLWGDKHPHFDQCLPSLLRWFPQARYVYIVRHPLDVICSIAAMNRWDRAEAFEHWKLITEGYERQVAAIPDPALYVLRYEDLVGKLRATLEGIFHWLALDTAEETFQAMTELATIPAHALVRTADGSDTARAPEATRMQGSGAGRWREAMGAEEAAGYMRETHGFIEKYYPELVTPRGA